MRKSSVLLILFFCCSLYVIAQKTVEVYPTNWFVGMKNPNLQLMVHHPNIADGATVSLSYPGVTLIKTNKVENSNYLFLDLRIASTVKPGVFKIIIKQKDNSY